MRRPLSRKLPSTRIGWLLMACAIVALLLVSSASWIGSGSPRPVALGSAATSHLGPSVSPPAPPCYSINATICVAVQNSSVPNIIPAAGSHVSAVHPSPNATISLWVESEFSLVWPNAKTSGPHSPLSLNATGVLWNGVPYYSAVDGTTWHAPGADWYTLGPTFTNASYPYFYGLNFTTHAVNGAPNWFAGMTLTWWVYIVTNTSGVLRHLQQVNFTFTFGGAWPYSPYAGTPQYAGPAAAGEDLSVTQSPIAPNYNDSVKISIATTPADLITGATIGGAYLQLSELAPDGALLDSETLTFPVGVSGTVGQVQSNVTVSPLLAHTPGALVEYRVTAWDTNLYGPDQIQTAQSNYTVNGNGSFTSGVFADDLNLTTTPGGISVSGVPAQVAAGQPINLQLTSKNAGTSIYAAEIVYTFNYTATNENVTSEVAMHRDNSTNFNGTLPGMPLNAAVQFQIYAWDFAQTRDVSQTYSFVTKTLNQTVPTVPSNSTFFFVYVYDNGTHTWVSGADVQIVSPSGFVRVDATTFDGVAYPNQTGKAFVPLLLQADTTYLVTVNDSSFHPGGVLIAPSVAVSFFAPHNLSGQAILETGTDFTVAQAGNALYFWLNQTAPTITYSAPNALGTSTVLAAAIGLAAFAIGIIPLMMWYSRIQARRVAQERRITL
jgi:hypothetical protein